MDAITFRKILSFEMCHEHLFEDRHNYQSHRVAELAADLILKQTHLCGQEKSTK